MIKVPFCCPSPVFPGCVRWAGEGALVWSWARLGDPASPLRINSQPRKKLLERKHPFLVLEGKEKDICVYIYK